MIALMILIKFYMQLFGDGKNGKESYYIKRADLENLNMTFAEVEIDEDYIGEIEDLETPELEISNQENSSKISPPNITIICVATAVIIFLMSIVILKLFNRKHNKE